MQALKQSLDSAPAEERRNRKRRKVAGKR